MADWLDIIPAIPLARGVPVINIKNGARKVVVKVEGGLPVLAMTPAVRPPVAPKLWRVDLGDPLGFAWALRYVTRHHDDPSVLRNREIGPERWLHDEPCDDERMDLARCLQEVYHEKVLKELTNV